MIIQVAMNEWLLSTEAAVKGLASKKYSDMTKNSSLFIVRSVQIMYGDFCLLIIIRDPS